MGSVAKTHRLLFALRLAQEMRETSGKHDLPPGILCHVRTSLLRTSLREIPNMLVGWRSEQIQPPPAADDDFRHSTSPEARMNLLLRFETDSGPRTIVAAGIPLRAASEIAHAMKCAGHFAELTDYLPPVTMAERMKHRRAEDAFTNAYSTIVEPPRPKQPTRCAAGVSGSHWSAAS
jgi:hypothetical protein